MGWLAFGLLMLVFMLTTKTPEIKTKKTGLGDIRVNTTNVERSIVYFCGKELLRGNNVFWYGDLKVEAIKESSGGLFGGTSTKIGEKISLGIGLALSYGAGVTLHQIRVGNFVAWEGTLNTDGASGTIDEPTLFGPKKKEGGVAGSFKFYTGSTSQTEDPYLLSKVDSGAGVPAYRNLSYISFEQMYWGNSPSIKQLVIEASRYPNPLSQANHIIGEDANAAYFIYEILTNKLSGVGIETSRIDSASFIAAGLDLFNEGLGVTFAFDSATTGSDAIGEILRHINGYLFSDLADGLVNIGLVRDTYDINTIPEITDADIIAITNKEEGSLDTVNSEVKIKYVDRNDNYMENIAPSVNSAARVLIGRSRSSELEYYGLRTNALAAKVSWRELKTTTNPLIKISISLRRTINSYGLRKGSVFKLVSVKYGITLFVARVLSTDYGDLKKNTIELKVVQDVFATGTAIFNDNPPTSFVPLVGAATDAAIVELVEMPYFYSELYEAPTPTFFNFVVAPTGHVDYDIWNRFPGDPYELDYNGATFVESGLLFADISQTDSTFVVTELYDPAVVATENTVKSNATNIILIVEGSSYEFMAYYTASFTAGGVSLVSVKRGLLDTLPKAFTTAARCYEVLYFGLSAGSYTATDTINNKFLTNNLNDSLLIADATEHSITLNDRADRPYPPRQVLINTVGYPASVIGDLVIDFKHNDRVNYPLLFEVDASVTIETAASYTIEIYNHTLNTLLHQEIAYTGTSFTYTMVDESTENGAVAGSLRVEISTQRAGKDSWETYVHSFTRTTPPIDFNLTASPSEGYDLTEILI